MDFYFFTSKFDLIEELDEVGFHGALFTYNVKQSDFFTRIAKKISPETRIKYMVAIRPYVISPQYLCMINDSLNEIAEKRLQINLISGHIKDEEHYFGGILGEVNDHSSSIERSKYLIEYVDMLESMNTTIPDYYVSVTNEFTFATASKYNSKMIIQYSQYMNNFYDTKDKRVMISVTPILRKNKEDLELATIPGVQHRADMDKFTYEEFYDIVKGLNSKGINQVIFSSWSDEETRYIIDFVKYYKEKDRSAIK
jgi:hypothetical protein